MPERRANDAQVERLLQTLKSDLGYRKDLARRIAQKEGIKYDSAMRRLQRYITEAGEKRSFAHAPIEKKRAVREDYREHERQIAQRQVVRPIEPERVQRRDPLYEEDRDFDDDESEGEFDSYEVHLNDVRSIIAYHDGDITETARALGLSRRGRQLLDFQVRSDIADTKADILSMAGGGAIADAVRDFLNNLTSGTAEELQNFADLLFNRSDWEIGVILEDLRSGATTFADWFDAWEDDGFNPDAMNSEYWRVWREAYKRVTA